jgi:phosphatidylserine/phosphatidylglycerophosphate/cardiolipin synthase-like enzyme/uncharacterized membrane protein YdjX (TVP38/TMEM64 family)
VDHPRTLFRPGNNCAGVAQAGRAAFLVDGEEYYDAFVRAAERAERTITLVGWDFDSRTVLRFAADGEPEVVLGDFLNGLVQKNRHLRIRILDWDYPMIFGRDREFPPIYGIAWTPHRHVDIRYDDTHPMAGSHHQKIVVIDERVAFAGGIDLSSKRWDSHAHKPGDPRRAFLGEPYPPMHDVMALVDGDAARMLGKTVRARWKAATGETLKAVEVEGDGWPEGVPVAMTDVAAALACTAPPCGDEGGVHHVEQLYLDMIAAARDYIYVENQYFTAQAIADALKKRLAEPDGPEIVVLTRLLSHGWLEEVTMHALRTRLVNELRAADPHDRFRVYYPHVDDLVEGTCIDLHSKVMIVDDEWLRVGSSNLSNRSMGMDSECDLTFEARGVAPLRTAVRAFRDQLLAEHAGTDAATVAAAVEQHGSLAAAIEALPRHARRIETLETPELSDTALSLAALGDLERPLPLESIVQEFAPDTSSVGVGPGRRAIALMCLLAVALALAWTFSPLADLVTRENVTEWGREFSRFYWAPVVVILAYTPASYAMFPRWLITMIAVIAFGPWKGFIYGIAGMLIAGLASFLPGRLVRRDTVRRLAGPRINRLSAALYHRGALAVAIVRMVPIAPFVVVNLVMGALRIRLRDFILGSLVGVLPGMLTATVLSEQVSRVLADPADLNGWLIAIAAALLLTLVYFGQRWLRRLDRQSGMTQ